MSVKYSQSFKVQAVEKALNRREGTGIKHIADSLGIGYSTLERWIIQSRNQAFESTTDLTSRTTPTQKRPHDWSPEERLNLVSACDSLDKASINALCRENGLYPHHVRQWKNDLVSNQTPKNPSETKTLRQENKALKKELNRKDQALAETATLLLLQKKVHAIWGTDADSSQ
ncbi:MAG: transposase [Methylococcales bacterium]